MKIALLILIFSLFGFGVEVVDNSLPVHIRVKTKLNTQTKYTSKAIIRCSPELKGVLFRVDSQDSVTIIPKYQFPSSKTFECQTADGKYRFEIKTKPFTLKSVNLFTKQRLLRLTFNDEVSQEFLGRFLEIFKRENLSKTKLQYKILSHDKDSFLIKILEPIDGDSLEVVINSGLQSKSGSTILQKLSKNVSLRGYKYVKLNPNLKEMIIYDKPQMVPYKGDYALRLFFDDSFDTKEEVKPFVKIDGVSSFKVQKMDYISDMQRRDLNLSEDSVSYVDIVSDEFKPNKTYRVTLKKGLKNYRELKKDITFEVKTQDLPSFIYFPDEGVYLSNLGDIGFESVNVKEATLRVEKITPLNYRYFVVYANGDISKVKKFTDEIFSKDLILNSPKNVKKEFKFHIAELAKRGSGVYKISLNYKSKSKNRVYDHEASKVVFVSDIGINAKVSKEQLFVSLFSLKDNTPIKEAKVDILSEKNILLTSTKSSLDGVASADMKNLLSKKPKAIIVSTKSDKNFLILDKPINRVSFEKILKPNPKYRAYIYPQSDIVRPGMEINALIVIKDKSLKSASKIPIKIDFIRVANFESIYSKSFTTSNSGVVDFALKTPYYERSGAYFLKVYFGDELIGKKRIDIESFLPPQIKTDIKVSNGGCVDNFLSVEIDSKYLFGADASNLGGTISIKGVEGLYKNPKFADYNFSSNSKESDLLLIDDSFNIKLDDKGRLSLKLPCTINSPYKPTVVDTTVGATIFDGNQPVSAYKRVKIYPYSKVVGIKLQKSLFEQGEPLAGWAILIEPKSNQEIKADLIGKIYKLNWFYTYEDGNYKWSLQRELFDSFLIKDGKFNYKDLPEGEYELKVVEPLSGAFAKVEFEVGGWGYSNPRDSTNPKRVSIEFQDIEYKRGDNLKVSIKSPIIEGKLLLTFERDKVLWHKLYPLSKGSALVDIPLDINLSSGVYLGALAIRKTDSSISPFRAFGAKLIRANQRDRAIKIDLDLNSTTQSNSKVNLKISTDRECDILVSVVDEGILNITNQTPPNPFSFFTPPPDLAVAMFDIYDKVIGYLAKGKLLSFGAGDEGELLSRKKHLPPPDTERVKPFMLWSGVIHTKNKEANFTIDVPEFNGRARVSVLAIDNNSIGSKSRDLVVKDDIVLKPSAPRFLLKGDKLKLPIRLINTTDKEIKTTLRVDNSNNLKLSLKSMDITLKPDEQRVIWYKLEALKMGKAKLRFQVSKYKREIELSINSPYTLSDYIQKGSLRDRESKLINIPKEFLKGDSLISISSNPLGSLRGDLRYLISYPYGCAEQTASRIGAIFWSKGFLRDKLLQKKGELFIREGVRKLSRAIMDTGEIKYWQSGNFVEPYASVYVSDILLEINSPLLSSQNRESILTALRLIASLDNSTLNGSYSNLLECYSGYILAREKEPFAKSILNMLYEKGICKDNKIANLYLASGFMESNQTSLAKSIYQSSKISLEEFAKERDYGYPFGGWKWRLFTSAYLKAKYFGLSDREFNTLQNQFNYLYSTQDKALAIRATRAYLNSFTPKEMEALVTINGKSQTISSDTTISTKLSSDTIKIASISGVVSYAVDIYKYLPKPLKNRVDVNSEFGISREFLTKDGSKAQLNNLQLKDELFAKVTLINRTKIDNLLIDMRVPSCMEIIDSKNYRGKFTNYNIEFNYKDVKDDRVLLSTSLNELVVTQKDSLGRVRKLISPNTHTFYIPLRVTTLGECKLPAILAEAMYDERFRDYAKEAESITVREKRVIIRGKGTQRDEVERFIREYYDLEAKTAPASYFIPFFHLPLKNFFGKKYLSSRDLMISIDRYNRVWPEREYKIKSISLKDVGDGFIAKVEFDYTLKRGNKKRSGSSTQYLKIKKYNQSYQIDSIDTIRR